MGRNHLRVLSLLPGAEVVAVADPSEERRHTASELYPQVQVFAGAGEAAERVQPDFACVAVPARALTEVATELIERGIPVLVEKPGGPTSQTIRDLGSSAEREGVVLGTGYVERFNPAVVALKQKAFVTASRDVRRRLSGIRGAETTPPP